MTPVWLPTQSGLDPQTLHRAGPAQAAERFASLQADLESARGEYGLRRYNTVARILDDMVPELRQLRKIGKGGSSRYALLLASALCLKGRMHWRLQQMVEQQKSFVESAGIFKKYERALNRHPSKGRLQTDYGIALFRIGQDDAAEAFLNKACASGAAPAEVFYYLGLVYLSRNDLKQAEDALRKGQQMAPGDKHLLTALAETLAKAKRNSRAVRTFCEAAIAAGQEEDLAEAKRLLLSALELSPTDAQALSMITILLQQMAEEQTATDLLDRALGKERGHPWALGLKAWLLNESGDRAGAIALWRRVDVSSPELAWVLVHTAKALHDEAPANDAEALGLLDRAAALDPGNPEILLIKAEIKEGTDSEAAADLLRQASDLSPRSLEIRHSLAQLLTRARNYDAASAELDKILEMDRRFVPALITKGEVLEAQQKFAEALDYYRTAADGEPDNEAVFEALVRTLLHCGLSREALDELNKRIARSPDNWAAYWEKGKILLTDNRLNDARLTFVRATEINPEHVGIQLDLGWTLGLLDDYEEAGRVFERAMTINGDSIEVRSNTAKHLIEIAEYAAAVTILRGSVEIAPDHGWSYRGLAFALQSAGEATSEEILALLAKAATLDPNDPWSKLWLAEILDRTDQAKEAKRTLETLISQYTTVKHAKTDASLMALLGWCHYLLGRYERAQYDEAVRLLQTCTSIDDSDAVVRFDLALVFLASRPTIGEREYARAIDCASSKHRLRQRGLFHVALMDLIDAVGRGQIADGKGWEAGRRIHERLHSCLARTDFDPKLLKSLDYPVPFDQHSA